MAVVHNKFENPRGSTTDRGAWNSGTAYVAGDKVSANDGYYVAIANNTNVDPTTDRQMTKWQPLSYTWDINHDTEQPFSKTRNIERTAPVGSATIPGGRMLVKQQGDDGPLQIKVSGNILKRSHLRWMWRFYNLSRAQTIYFTDFDGAKYEVQVVEFAPTRKRTLNNYRDPSMPNHYITYEITMEVYTVISGDMLGVSP